METKASEFPLMKMFNQLSTIRIFCFTHGHHNASSVVLVDIITTDLVRSIPSVKDDLRINVMVTEKGAQAFIAKHCEPSRYLSVHVEED